MSTVAAVIQRGTRGAQPAATAVSIGTLYCVTDESNLVERSNGTIWQSYSASGAGSGTVTNTGTLTSGKTIVGNGTVDVTVSSLTATVVKSASGVLSAASAGTDYIAPSGALGTPSSGTLTNCSGLSAATGLTGVLPGLNGGGLVLLEQHTASTSSSLDFTTAISSTYDEYLIEFKSVLPTTNAVNLLMRMNTGSGFDSGANYSYVDFRWNTGAVAAGGNTGQTAIALNNPIDGIANTAAWGYCGTMKLFRGDGSTTFARTIVDGSLLTGSTREAITSRGAYEVTTPITQFQFLMSSGTIASGIIRCYGVAK